MSESRPVKNKRILVLANFDMGLYKFRKALLSGLIARGHEVYIALPRGEFIPDLEALGCRYIETALERRGMNPLRDISLYRQYRRILKKIQPDLVIGYTIKPNVYGGFACRMAKIPFAANITGLGSAIEGGGMLKRLVLAMYRIGLKKARTVFFENEGNRDVLLEAGTVRSEQTRLLMGAGIDTDEYRPLPYPDTAPIRFLFVGRIMKEKGVDELFDAMTRLKAEYDSVILDVVGLFEESYQQKIEALQKEGILCFHGYQTDVKPYYEAAHAVVLPSYHEGMSNVLLEGAACARPLITSRIHGCMEAVDDGVNGYLCEPQDPDSLYAAMKRFCTLPQSERAAMGLAGRALMETMFDKKIVVEETMKGLGI